MCPMSWSWEKILHQRSVSLLLWPIWWPKLWLQSFSWLHSHMLRFHVSCDLLNACSLSKSAKYEMCPTSFDQCGYSQLSLQNASTLSNQFVKEQVVKVSDDAFWRSISLSPNSSTPIVCSYLLKSQDNSSISNVFELKFSKDENTLIGLYYYSTFI